MEVLLQRFGVMGEVACTLTVENLVVETEGLEELGEDDAAHGVDGIGTDAELALADGLDIDEFQLEHGVDMTTVVGVVDGAGAELVDLCVMEVFGLCDAEHFGTVGSGEELALVVEQLQGVPLAGVVRGGDDDAAVSLSHAYGELGRRCGGVADVDDIVAHTHKGAYDDVADHEAGDSAVATDDDLMTTDELCIGSGKLDDV